ncbi:hypothetical protein [Roseimaritima multifibrata]|nr:hypothetical protein [Roseimaritima multifibrata]
MLLDTGSDHSTLPPPNSLHYPFLRDWKKHAQGSQRVHTDCGDYSTQIVDVLYKIDGFNDVMFCGCFGFRNDLFRAKERGLVHGLQDMLKKLRSTRNVSKTDEAANQTMETWSSNPLNYCGLLSLQNVLVHFDVRAYYDKHSPSGYMLSLEYRGGGKPDSP